MRWLLAVFGLLFLLAAPSVWGQETLDGNSAAVHKHGVMKPDEATREKWYLQYLNAPESHIDPTLNVESTGAKPDHTLLDYIVYTPSDRNQNVCGNCWVWAGTAALEIKHSVETGVNDRLSVQWFDSAFYGWSPPDNWQTEGTACNGGDLTGFLKFYNSHELVPWSNKNAYFQDGDGGPPSIPASSISAIPYYYGDVNAFEAHTVPTTNVSQATAIANIKNVLNQKEAVLFMITWATDADFDVFHSWWDDNSESDIFDPDTVCGDTEINGQVQSHYLTVVGYNDSDSNPDNHYWLVLNSWGTTAKRPNGLFRMKMNMNYGCYETTTGDQQVFNRQFQNVETAAGKTAFYDTNRLFMSDKGAKTDSIWYTDHADGDQWPTPTPTNPGYKTLSSGGTDASPTLATFNTRQYMAVKGATDDNIHICSMDYTGTWSSWTTVTGGNTDRSPALVTYKNHLYLFQKDAGKQTVSYASMDTSGAWSTWTELPTMIATSHSPAVVVQDNQLHLFVTAANDGVVCFTSMQTDGTWTGWYSMEFSQSITTDAPPHAAVYNGNVYVVVKGATSNKSISDKIYYASGDMGTAAGSWNLPGPWNEIPGNAHTAYGPWINTGPDVNTLTVAIAGQTSTNLYTQTCNENGWAKSWSKITIPGVTSNTTPALNTFWF